MTNNKGFTLLEMLVALAVASILMLGIFGVTGQMGQSVQKNDDILKRDMAIFAAMSQFEKDIFGYAKNMQSPNPFELQFMSVKGPSLGQSASGISEIRYLVETTPEGKARLLRQEADSLFSNIKLSTDTVTAESIYFVVHDENGREQSPWRNASAPPTAISLHINTGGEATWVRTVPLLVRTP